MKLVKNYKVNILSLNLAKEFISSKFFRLNMQDLHSKKGLNNISQLEFNRKNLRGLF
ncbi:MAG: hypothetical protein PF569_03540 [Candidatus Woesearchaeota archaeon]|jgi:hypothetical protein|nr:hypothetical protein [Candidatus Woesearchaeota archaeon]